MNMNMNMNDLLHSAYKIDSENKYVLSSYIATC